MNRRSFLSFFGFAPSAPLFSFHAASPDARAKFGCSGFVATESALTSDDLARLKAAWPGAAVDLKYLEGRKFTIDEIAQHKSSLRDTPEPQAPVSPDKEKASTLANLS